MKVSEAIDQLEVGDTVWVKSKVTAINFEGGYIRSENTKTSIYLDGDAEISLTEPQAEKVEVPEFVAEWFEIHKDELEYHVWRLIIKSNEDYADYESDKTDMRYWIQYAPYHPIETLLRMKDGYTVKPKRWVVKFNDAETDFYFMGWSDIYKTDDNPFVPNGYVEKDKGRVFIFTDKAKAEAVATLVEGSVEEV